MQLTPHQFGDTYFEKELPGYLRFGYEGPVHAQAPIGGYASGPSRTPTDRQRRLYAPRNWAGCQLAGHPCWEQLPQPLCSPDSLFREMNVLAERARRDVFPLGMPQYEGDIDFTGEQTTVRERRRSALPLHEGVASITELTEPMGTTLCI